MVLTTDHPKQPETRLVVTGQMAGPVNLVPGVLRMHEIDARAGGRGAITVSVRNNRETAFEVTHAPKGLKVEVTPVPGGRKGRYQVSVIVPPGTPAQKIEDEIVLKTDHPKATEVMVPLSLWIQDLGVQ